MKMLEGKKMNSSEGILLLASTVFFVMSFVLFVKRDDSGGAKAKELVEDVKTTVEGVETNQRELSNESKTMANAFTSAIGGINQRLEVVEKKLSDAQNVNVNIPSLKVEPIEIIYRHPVAPLPQPPKELVNKKVKPGSPLSKKAGLLPKENN